MAPSAFAETSCHHGDALRRRRGSPCRPSSQPPSLKHFVVTRLSHSGHHVDEEPAEMKTDTVTSTPGELGGNRGCLCRRVCVSFPVCSGAWGGGCTCVVGGGGCGSQIILSIFPRFSEAGSLIFTGNSLKKLGKVAGEQAPQSSCLELRACTTTTSFLFFLMWVTGIKLKQLCLPTRATSESYL